MGVPAGIDFTGTPLMKLEADRLTTWSEYHTNDTRQDPWPFADSGTQITAFKNRPSSFAKNP